MLLKKQDISYIWILHLGDSLTPPTTHQHVYELMYHNGHKFFHLHKSQCIVAAQIKHSDDGSICVAVKKTRRRIGSHSWCSTGGPVHCDIEVQVSLEASG